MNSLKLLLFLPFASSSTDLSGVESGSLYTLLSSVGGRAWKSEAVAPSLSASGFADTDSYACGFQGTVKDNEDDGIWNLDIIYCHKFDSSVSETKVLVDEDSGKASKSYSQKCADGQFITGVRLKYESSRDLKIQKLPKKFTMNCGSNDGITGIKFQCSTFPGYSSGDHSSWMELYSTNQGSWDDAYYHSTKLICGATASYTYKGSCGVAFFADDGYGVDGMQLRFCEAYDCRSTISQLTTIPDQQYYVNHGEVYSSVSDYVYAERHIYYGWFNTFWQNTDTTNCPYTSCAITTNSEVVLHNWANNNYEMLKVNQDPQQEYSISLQITCVNREPVSSITSNSFTITVSCGDNVTMAIPSTFSASQSGETTTVVANWNQFDFDSFVTYTSACQVDYYEVFLSEQVQSTPTGIAENTYDEAQASGTTNQNQFAVKVSNGETPYQYQFYIKATAMGGNTFWTNQLTLTTYCPSEVQVEPKSALSTSVSSCVGANLIGQGTYTFPEYSPSLPMCQEVLGYSVTNVSPSSSVLTYPLSTCNDYACYKIGFDDSTVQTITFQIEISTSINAGQSSTTETITIDVLSACVALAITAPDVSSLANNNQVASSEYQLFIGTSTQNFYFSLFTCSTGCGISYSISPATSGLGSPTYNSSSNSMVISVDDTSLTTYTFQLYGELTDSTTINALTNEIKINIVCGSETVTVTRSSLVKNAIGYDAGTTYQIQFADFYSEFGSNSINSMFSSSKSACPLTKYTLYKDISTGTLWSSSSDSTDAYITLESESFLNINIQTPFRKTVQIKGETAYGNYNYLSLDITICGNELLSASSLSSSYILKLNEALTIEKTTYTSWFVLTGADHTDCEEITYELFEGSNCDQSANKWSMSATEAIEFVTSSAYEVKQMCLKATTKGQKTAQQVLEVEVCGSEVLSMTDDSGNGKISQVYDYDSGTQMIYVSSEGFTFQSDRSNCPIYSYYHVKHSSFHPLSIASQHPTPTLHRLPNHRFRPRLQHRPEHLHSLSSPVPDFVLGYLLPEQLQHCLLASFSLCLWL